MARDIDGRHTTHKGRGTGLNPANRYHAQHIIAVDDGWEAQVPPSRLTEVREEQARRIISRNRSPDVPFEQSINPYRGCEHGCVYCFARPSHAYWDLSPGIDFETRLIAKPNAVARLEQELSHPGYVCKPIAMGTNTDPYQPLESERRITRGLLDVMLRYRHPVTIVTKGALILRDVDILSELAYFNLVRVSISMTTLDSELKRRLEPRAASGEARLRVIRQLREAGVPVDVLCAPVIPGLNDHELERMLAASAEAGAQGAGWVMLRLPLELVELFEDWLRENYPLKADHVLSLVKQTRNGQMYDADFSQRMRGSGVFADLVAQRFRLALKRHGLEGRQRPPLDCSQFAPPGQQMGLFSE